MWLSVNINRVVDFLVGLLNTPSPTGYHEEAIDFVQRALEELAFPGLSMRRNVKGALIVTLEGESDSAPRALSAHVDTLGAIVREVKGNGRLLLSQIGGYAWQAVESEGVTVHCVRSAQRWRGTIQSVTPSMHTSNEMREGKREDERMEVRLDLRASSKEQTQALGIDVGDFCFFDPRVEVTESGYIKSRFLDDKAGVAVVYGALYTLKEMGIRPAQRTTFLVSNYEEVGHGAAVGLPADAVELLVVDMAASTTGEHQNSDEYSVGICAKDSSGPYDLAMRIKLMNLCDAFQIPFKVDTYPHYGSDGSAYLAAGGDVRVGLIGPGVDASHAYERTHRDSLEATVALVARYLADKG
ncbi:MAG: M42 family metallopeptidase [Anaerolineae bacterium]